MSNFGNQSIKLYTAMSVLNYGRYCSQNEQHKSWGRCHGGSIFAIGTVKTRTFGRIQSTSGANGTASNTWFMKSSCNDNSTGGINHIIWKK